MKLIKPSEISGKIMTLIEEAEYELIIISPYNDVSAWTKLIIKIKNSQERGVKIAWYARKNNVQKSNADEVRTLNIEPVLIDNLHAKVYLNEFKAILATMNLSSRSDDKSIDLGYETETELEYTELRQTVEKYIIKRKKQINDVCHEGKKSLIIKNNSAETKIREVVNPELQGIFLYTKSIYKFLKEFSNEIKKIAFVKNGSLVNITVYGILNIGETIAFEAYSQALKITIDLSHLNLGQNFYKSLDEKLIGAIKWPRELECYDNKIKYYYQLYNRKLEDWEKDEISDFLREIEKIISEVVFTAKKQIY